MIIEEIRKNSKITRKQLVVLTGVSLNGIKKQIETLKKDGILIRVGGRKTGYWKVKAKEYK